MLIQKLLIQILYLYRAMFGATSGRILRKKRLHLIVFVLLLDHKCYSLDLGRFNHLLLLVEKWTLVNQRFVLRCDWLYLLQHHLLPLLMS